MKGDFSRIRFSKKKNYRKVLYQQGRVSTDADQNEQVNIQVDHETSYLRDIIGKTGVPIEQKESSFKITPFITAEGVSYTIGKGRIYVDGILVENYSDIEARIQPYFPLLSIQDLPSDIIAKEPGLYLVYLDVWDRHITYLEDPDIQESALGGPDTTTRSQTVWQVKLHKLEEGDNINVNEAGENRWAPWESLDNNVFDLRIGTNTDGSFLEVFALSDLVGNKGKRMSIRQVSLNPVRWEDEWDVAPEGFHELEIEVATNSKGFLEMFGIDDDQLEVKRSVREENSRWGSWKDGPLLNGFNLPAKAIAVGKNNDGSLMLFAINLEDNKIYYSKQINTTLEWEDWKPIFNLEVINLALITNPNDNCIEVYAMDNSGRILYTRQERPDATTWKDWKRINQHTNPSEPRRFSTVTVGINRNKQPIIFATVSENDRNVWYTIRNELDFPEGNGWKVVGHNSPGVPISSITLQNNVKKDRLELFSIFADSPQIRSGIIWNIYENEDGSWNSNWKTIAGFKAKMMVYSATDNLSRLNIFAIDETGSVNHSYDEGNDLPICELPIPSWDSKVIPSSLQIQAHTRPEELISDPCMLPERAGYRRLENQLYRIEIHKPKSGTKNATFKYSRDNGTVSSKILDISDGKISVASLGRDSLLRFDSGQIVEVTSDFHDLRGISGVLVPIIDVKGTDLTFNKDALPSDTPVNNESFPQKFNPKIRRWDSRESMEVKIPSENDGFLAIEDGIEIKFSSTDAVFTDAVFKTGDYWTIPARTSKADIEWPKDNEGFPEFVDTEGIKHHYAKLAFFTFVAGGLEGISDCRKFFTSLSILNNPHPQPKPELPEPKILINWTSGSIAQIRVHPGQTQPFEDRTPNGVLYRQTVTDSTLRNRFHFPMTVSCPLESDKKITLQSIHLLYFCEENRAVIETINVFEGGRQRKRFTGLGLTGDHSTDDKKSTFSLEPEIEVKGPVSIELEVIYPIPVNEAATIILIGAGIQLKVN